MYSESPFSYVAFFNFVIFYVNQKDLIIWLPYCQGAVDNDGIELVE
jgi:hypothetical protein